MRGRVAPSTEIRRDLQVAIQGTSKTLFVNGKRETVARYLGQLSVVTFTAEELEVTRGSPEARRRFLDKAIVSIHSTYVQTLSDYIVHQAEEKILNNIQPKHQTEMPPDSSSRGTSAMHWDIDHRSAKNTSNLIK